MIFGVFACGQKQEKESEPVGEASAVEQRRKEVIAVHDEVMPLMSDIYQAKRRIREATNNAELPAEFKTQANEVIALLDSADQGMRVWMREFSKLELDDMEEKDALAVLDREMERITKVKHDMEESLRRAKEFSLNDASTESKQ